MCWISYKFPKRKKANKPIKVYKFLTSKLKSPYRRGFKYSFGTLNKEIYVHPFEGEGSPVYHIFKGYHSYGTKTNALFEASIYNCGVKNKAKVYECIIPKGTHYFINSRGDVVSDNIIITDRCVGQAGKDFPISE